MRDLIFDPSSPSLFSSVFILIKVLTLRPRKLCIENEKKAGINPRFAIAKSCGPATELSFPFFF